MKRLILLIILLALTACSAPPLELVPPATLAAQTLAAMPKPTTPAPPTAVPVPTATSPSGPPTPALDLNLPGAYCIPANTTRTHALVTKVLDGGEIEVVIGLETLRVRYIGLTAPGISAPAEWQAAQSYGYNSNLVNGKVITLIKDVSETDASGALLRYVVADNVFVNYEMVRQGYARTASMPPDLACDNALVAAQVEAQGAVRGVWQPTPIPTSTITPTPTITFTPLPFTSTPEEVCGCKSRKSCTQFTSQRQAQNCYNYCLKTYNVNVLPDNNNNGRVCEGLP